MKSFIKRCEVTKDIDERRELSLYASLMKGYYKIFLANRYRQEASYFAEETKKEIYGKYLTRQDNIETVINSDNELENAYWFQPEEHHRQLRANRLQLRVRKEIVAQIRRLRTDGVPDGLEQRLRLADGRLDNRVARVLAADNRGYG